MYAVLHLYRIWDFCSRCALFWQPKFCADVNPASKQLQSKIKDIFRAVSQRFEDGSSVLTRGAERTSPAAQHSALPSVLHRTAASNITARTHDAEHCCSRSAGSGRCRRAADPDDEVTQCPVCLVRAAPGLCA